MVLLLGVLMRLSVLSAALLVGFAAQGAQASILDLNSQVLANGAIITNQFAGVTISGVGNGAGDTASGNNFAINFNTNQPGPGGSGDPDLGAPFDDPTTGVVEAFRPGNILVVAEGGCNGVTCRQDDNGSGGSITINFGRLVQFNSFSVFDFGTNELSVQLFDLGGALIGTIVGPTINTDVGDGANVRLFTNIFVNRTIASAIFTFGGSGGIGNFNISEVPVPAALPLLLSGLAGLGFAARRRRNV